MIDEMVTGVGWRVSQREVIFAAMVSGSSEVLFVPTCTITSETLCFDAVSLDRRDQLTAFSVSSVRHTVSNVESQVFTPNNSRLLARGSNPGRPRDKLAS